MQDPLPQPVFVNVEYLFQKLYTAVEGTFRFIFSLRFLYLLYVGGVVFIILLIAGGLYCIVRLYEMKQEDKKKKATAAKPVGAESDGVPLNPSNIEKKNETWEAIRTKLLSDNHSDWRLAIIEADIYMDRTLDYKGYHGATVADKLKAVDPMKLASLQMAWEAHKMRNRIAHEGASFTLTMPEARRILSYYEIVFRDLDVIA